MSKGIDNIGVAICFFCHDGNGKYLFHQRTDNCRDEHWTWDPGGGGVDVGENLEAALRREVKEEYGADILEFNFLGFREVFREHAGVKTHWISFDYRVRVDPNTVSICEPEKMSQIGWFTLDALPEPPHSQLLSTIEKNRAYL